MAHLCCLFVKNKTTDTKCNSEMDLTGMDKQLKKQIATSLGENDFESISYPETKKYAPFRSVFYCYFSMSLMFKNNSSSCFWSIAEGASSITSRPELFFGNAIQSRMLSNPANKLTQRSRP